jgi:hypothetical protein
VALDRLKRASGRAFRGGLPYDFTRHGGKIFHFCGKATDFAGLSARPANILVFRHVSPIALPHPGSNRTREELKVIVFLHERKQVKGQVYNSSLRQYDTDSIPNRSANYRNEFDNKRSLFDSLVKCLRGGAI